MTDIDEQYQNALSSVEASIETALDDCVLPYENEELLEACESSLDGWDYCYALAIGIAGIAIATNETFAVYLDEIHKAASGASGDYDFFQKALGKLLHHKGDWIDAVNMPFKNRNGDNVYCLFHRLLWGHDIFSAKQDNPFSLMFRQKGMLGILQAVRHLLADTASKQGLPLPFSSFLDFTTEEGKTSNYLIKIAQKLSEESIGNKANAQAIYSHLATIRAQDITAGVVVKLFSEVYFQVRKIDDDIRKSEIRLIAYAVNFFGEAIVGSVKQKGIPYINIPLAGAMAVSFGRFCYINAKEEHRLASDTEACIKKSEDIMQKHHYITQFISHYDSVDDLLNSYNQVDSNAKELIDFFEGAENK